MTLPAGFQEEVQKKRGDGAFIWCIRITADVSTIATTVFDLTPHPQAVTFDGDTYDPFPMSIGLQPDDADSLPRLDLSVSNATRFLVPYLEEGNGFMGMPVRIRLVHSNWLAQADHVIEQTLVCRGATVSDATVDLTLDLPQLHQSRIPAETVTRGRCRFRFGDDRCQFPLGPSVPFTDCGKNIDDCIERGVWYLTTFGVTFWPLFFGAFRGVPRGVR